MSQPSQKNPWTVKSTKKVYSNPWIDVIHHEVLTPSDTEGIYGVVRFKNKAVGIIPIDQDGYTYLVGQFRFPLERYSWEIPEGGCPHNEDSLEAAKRELYEETGIRAQKWQVLCNVDLSNSVTDEVGTIYVAQDLSFNQPNPEETEELHLRKIHVKEALEMVQEGTITDGITMIGLLYLRNFIQS